MKSYLLQMFLFNYFSFFQLWDLNMDSGPVATFQVHEYLRPKVKLYHLNEN